jgi:hypothetical protein
MRAGGAAVPFLNDQPARFTKPAAGCAAGEAREDIGFRVVHELPLDP